jgi:hypothetical protein
VNRLSEAYNNMWQGFFCFYAQKQCCAHVTE